MSKSIPVLAVVALLIIGGGVFLYSQNQKSNLEGSWYWEEVLMYADDETKQEFFYDLSVDLKISGDEVTGQWFSTWRNASRINGCADSDVCLRGTVKGNAAVVDFDWTYDDKSGVTELLYDPATDTLRWRITKEPEGEYFAPEEAVLERVSH